MDIKEQCKWFIRARQQHNEEIFPKYDSDWASTTKGSSTW